MIDTTKTTHANGFIFEFKVSGVQNVFLLEGVAKRAGKVISSEMITGEKAGNWTGLFVPFNDETIKLAEKSLTEALSQQALKNIATLRTL